MRVKSEILHFIAAETKIVLKNCELYLFGSRVDDSKKGGDIDILILSNERLKLKDKLQIKRKFYQQFGEQKIDLINFLYTDNDPFKELILNEPNIKFC